MTRSTNTPHSEGSDLFQRLSDDQDGAVDATDAPTANQIKSARNAYAEASQTTSFRKPLASTGMGEAPSPAPKEEPVERSVRPDDVVSNAGDKARSHAKASQKAGARDCATKALAPQGDEAQSRLMTVGEVAGMLRVSRSTVWRLARKDPSFPAPIRIGGSTRWDSREIDDYIYGIKERRPARGQIDTPA